MAAAAPSSTSATVAAAASSDGPASRTRLRHDEFDRCLADMKPHVLKLQRKSERQRCALWIKKLCESAAPAASSSTAAAPALKIRNAYARVMLAMLRSGRLEAPFTAGPPDGPLQELPARLLVHFDAANGHEVPTWVANLSREDEDDGGGSAGSDDERQLQTIAPSGPSRLPVAVGRPAAAPAATAAGLGLMSRDKAAQHQLQQEQAASIAAGSRGKQASSDGVQKTSPSPTASYARPPLSWQGQQSEQQQQQQQLPHAGYRQCTVNPPSAAAAAAAPGAARRPDAKEQLRLSSDDEDDGQCDSARAGGLPQPHGGFAGGYGNDCWTARQPLPTRQLRTSSPYPVDSAGDGCGYQGYYGNFLSGDDERQQQRRADRAAAASSLESLTAIGGSVGIAALPPMPAFLRSGSPYLASFGGGGDGPRFGHATAAMGPASSGTAAATSPGSAQDRELEVRLKVLDARLLEEKLHLQQKHDAEVQKILDRKNAEIEEVKASYRNKVKEHEEAATKLEKKLHAVLKDSALVRESKDQQIAELRRLVEESTATRQNEAERRVHDLVAEHEQDKFELQKQHTRAIHELMDETGARLAKMEEEHRRQAAATGDVIRELENRIHLLTSDAERVTAAKSSLEQQKAELEARIEQLLIESNQYRVKFEALSAEHARSLEESRRTADLAREKYESQLSFVRREQSLAASKAADAIAELEQRVAALRQAADEAEARHQQQVREAESSRRQDAAQAERALEKKVRALQKEAEQQSTEHTKSLAALEGQVKEKEAELQRMREQQRQQAAAAERALAELKTQVERHSERMYAETKQQMAQVEQDLLRSKSVREQQAKEYDAQLKDVKRTHEKELQALRAAVEQEKQQLVAHERHQRELLLTAHQQEVNHLTSELNSEKSRYEEMLKEIRSEHERQCTGHTDELSALRDELVKNEQLRRQQLTELGLLRDEERQRQAREHERELAQVRADAERQRHELQRACAADTERAVEKAEASLRNLEVEYASRLGKSGEVTRELQAKLEQLKSTRRELTEQMELKLAEMATRCEEEKRSLRRQLSSTMVSLQEDVESQHAQLRQAERRLRDAQAEHEERVLRLTIEYESKMKGLMPASARQQLEDTIASLRNQVATLKQRVGLLQDELLDGKRLPPPSTALSNSGGSPSAALVVGDGRPLG